MGKTKKLLGVVLFCALSFAACDKGVDDRTREITSDNISGGGMEGGENDGTDVKTTGKPVDGETKDGNNGEESVDVPVVSFEILSVAETDSEGNELIHAQYPVFCVEGEGYDALAAALGEQNEVLKGQADSFLCDMRESAQWYRESVDASYQYMQKSYVYIQRCDKEFVSILVLREVEEGGAHPNNYRNALNFFSQTGEMVKLADIVTVDDALREKIRVGLHSNYPEFEFDDSLVEQEIAEALSGEMVEWYFVDGEISISFPEGSFGFGHAEGSLGVLIPADVKE